MTLEMFLFLLLFLFALVLSLIKLNKVLYFLISFFLLISYSVVVRLAGFDADIGNYSEFLKVDSFSIYYLKEPIYWLGSRYLFKLTGSEFFVFFFYDLIFIGLLLISCGKLNLPRYFPFVFFLFFPTVLGMQNVFRQFIASGFLILLLSLAFTGAKYRYRFFVLLLATLTHNVSLLFSPLVFISQNQKKFNLFFFVSCFGVFLLLPIAAGTKSDSNTGDLPPYLYLTIYLLVVVIYVVITRFNFNLKEYASKYASYLYMMFYFLFLIFLSVFILGGAQSKRVGMLSLLLSLVPLTLLIETRFKQKVLVRVLFIFAVTAPTLIFHNARSLLETSPSTLQAEAAARALNHH
ncbi:EpsG-like putative glucosyltransferase [Shewanella putrefaciens]|nr:EpsG-like putative glucosyltransferase [Shewanella putrefaciens]